MMEMRFPSITCLIAFTVVLNLQLKGSSIGHTTHHTLLNNDDKVNEHISILESYFDQINSGLYGMLQLKKSIAEGSTSFISSASYTIDDASCYVYVDIDPLELAYIDNLENAEVTKIDENATYIKFKHEEKELWIAKTCVTLNQKSSSTFSLNKLESSGLKWFRMAQQQMEISDQLYNSFTVYKEKKHDKIAKIISETQLDSINTLNQKIERKYKLVKVVFAKLSEGFDNTPSISNPLQLVDRLSINGQISFGTSNFNSNYFNRNPINNSSGNNEFRLNASYLINRSSKASLTYSNSSQTRFSNNKYSTLAASYSNKFSNNIIKLRASKVGFSDEGDRIKNNNKTQLGAEVRSDVDGSINYNIRYNYTNQNYNSSILNSNNKHELSANTIFGDRRKNHIKADLNALSIASDNAFLAFSYINPRITVNKLKLDKRTSLILSGANYSYSSLEQKDNNRIQLSYATKSLSYSPTQTRKELGIIVRAFPNDFIRDYMDAYIRSDKSSQQNGYKSNRHLLRIRYRPESIEDSHLDIRRGAERGNNLFIGYDMNIRLFYPTDISLNSRFDGYLKLGFSIAGIKLGPTFGWFGFYDFMDSENQGLENDKNSYMYGLEASGMLKPIEKLKVRFRVSYDNSTVFNRLFLEDGTDPLGELISRNPSNLQMDIDLSYRVRKSVELFGKINSYNHISGYVMDSSSQFLDNNNSTKFKIGARFRKS